MRILIILIIKLILLICVEAKFFLKRLRFNIYIFLLIFKVFEIRITRAKNFLKLNKIFKFLLILKRLILQFLRSFLIFLWTLIKLILLILLIWLEIHILMLIILISWAFMLLKIILTIFSLRTDFTFNYFNFLHRLLISILIKEIIIKVYNLLNFSILKLFILLFYFDKLLVFSIINKIFLLFFFFYAFCLFFLCLLFLLSFHKYLNR